VFPRTYTVVLATILPVNRSTQFRQCFTALKYSMLHCTVRRTWQVCVGLLASAFGEVSSGGYEGSLRAAAFPLKASLENGWLARTASHSHIQGTTTEKTRLRHGHARAITNMWRWQKARSNLALLLRKAHFGLLLLK
jgi:hypothetical protein